MHDLFLSYASSPRFTSNIFANISLFFSSILPNSLPPHRQFTSHCPIHLPSLNLPSIVQFTFYRSIYFPPPDSLPVAQFTSHCPIHFPSLNLLPTARFISYLPGLPLVFPSFPKFIQDGKRAHARIDFSSTSCNNVRISTMHGRLWRGESRCAVEFRSNKKKRKDTWQR